MAEDFGQPFKIAGFVILSAASALSLIPSGSVRGLIQRIAEVCLFTGLGWAAWNAAAGL